MEIRLKEKEGEGSAAVAKAAQPSAAQQERALQNAAAIKAVEEEDVEEEPDGGVQGSTEGKVSKYLDTVYPSSHIVLGSCTLYAH